MTVVCVGTEEFPGCGREKKNLRARGLCPGCGLGHFKDDPERLRKAAEYLEKARP